MNNEKWYLKIFQKLKKVKHIELYVAGLFAIIIVLVFISSSMGQGKKSETENISNMSVSEYATYLENRLSSVLSSIQGAGNVNVMVTLSSGIEYEYAVNEEIKTNTNGSTSTTITVTSPIIISNKPVIIKEYYPKVGGVVVVSSGAGNVAVKLELYKAIGAVLNVPTTNIEILVGNI